MNVVWIRTTALLAIVTVLPGAGLRVFQTAVPTSEEQVLALDKAWVTAEVTHDRKALQRILDEDFVVTNSSGKTSDRATFISGILSESIAPYDVAHDIVRVHGDTAVVVDRFGEGLATRATWVAVKRNGQWRVIFEHFSKLAKP